MLWARTCVMLTWTCGTRRPCSTRLRCTSSGVAVVALQPQSSNMCPFSWPHLCLLACVWAGTHQKQWEQSALWPHWHQGDYREERVQQGRERLCEEEHGAGPAQEGSEGVVPEYNRIGD